jgi:hypothetical protein
MLFHEWTPAHLARQFTRFVRLEAMLTDVVMTQIGDDPTRAELIAGAAKAGHMARPGSAVCARHAMPTGGSPKCVRPKLMAALSS